MTPHHAESSPGLRSDTDSDVGAPEDEIKVTPEMIEAGMGPLLCYHREYSDENEVLTEIYRAMVLAKTLRC